MTVLSRSRWPLALAAAAVLALPACSSDDPDPVAVASSIAAAVPTELPTGLPSVPTGLPGGANTVDACTLLEPAEIKAIVPTAGAGEPEGAGRCSWQDPDYNSVSIRVNLPGTAPGGELPEPGFGSSPEPGPDGIRFEGGTVAQFVLGGDRTADIQIETGAADQKQALIDLVAKVKARFQP